MFHPSLVPHPNQDARADGAHVTTRPPENESVEPDDANLLQEVWRTIGGAPDQLSPVAVGGPRTVLPAAFDVTGLAAATVAAAGLAAATTVAVRRGSAVPAVAVDRRAAAAAFASERLLAPQGWTLPPPWDPVAGDYRAADGWIRLHTNYPYHRAAVARVLGGAEDRESVATQVARWPAVELESAVVAAGGAAAVMYDRDHWVSTEAGAAAAAEPLARIEVIPEAVTSPAARDHGGSTGDVAPYAGVRVLDLTRVIAGPVATRFLAGFGADVLRIDPPGFAEVPALLPETTVGKRCAWLDLTTVEGRERFDDLVAAADVLVYGLRPGALDRLGYDSDALRERNPSLILAALDAYGWDGPWQDRRGFDSLVQMSCGIAAAGAAAAGVDRPVPLPVQALDHATGYLLAAAIGLALARRFAEGVTTRIRTSLAGTANLLLRLVPPDGISGGPGPEWTDSDTELAVTAWGLARRVPIPVHIHGVRASWDLPAGPLGRHEPTW